MLCDPLSMLRKIDNLCSEIIIEKEKLEEEVQILKDLSRNKDERIAEYEAVIKHKERECASHSWEKTSSFPFHLTLRNGH